LLLKLMMRFDEAEFHFRHALVARRSRFDRYRDAATLDDYLNSLSGFGDFLHDMKELDEVELLYREGLALRREHFPAADIEVAKGLIRLAVVLQDQGKVGEAVLLYRAALPAYVRIQGEGSQVVETIRSNLASIGVGA
jgi:tetratricopeptide (TPR) repeat protein